MGKREGQLAQWYQERKRHSHKRTCTQRYTGKQTSTHTERMHEAKQCGVFWQKDVSLGILGCFSA